jgi:hypothetical protein
MALETVASIFDILKQEFDDKVIDQVALRHTLLEKFERETQNVNYGQEFVFFHRVGRNISARVTAEREDLPTAVSRKFQRGLIPPFYLYQPIDLTGPQIARSKGGVSPIDMLGDAITDAMVAFRFVLNSIHWGDGSGRICQIVGSPTHAGGVSTITILAGPTGNIHHFSVGQKLTADDGTTEYQVLDTDPLGDTIEVSGDVTGDADWVDGNYIYRAGHYDVGMFSEPLGLAAHIADTNPPGGNYQGKDRSATGFNYLNSFEKGTVGDNTIVSTNLFLDHFGSIFARGKKLPPLSVVSDGVRDSIVLWMHNQHIHVQEVVDHLGFASRLRFVYAGRSMELESHLEAPPGEMMSFDPVDFVLLQIGAIGWLRDPRGGGNLRLHPTKDVIQGYLKWFWNLACKYNQGTGKRIGIKENAIS